MTQNGFRRLFWVQKSSKFPHMGMYCNIIKFYMSQVRYDIGGVWKVAILTGNQVSKLPQKVITVAKNLTHYDMLAFRDNQNVTISTGKPGFRNSPVSDLTKWIKFCKTNETGFVSEPIKSGHLHEGFRNTPEYMTIVEWPDNTKKNPNHFILVRCKLVLRKALQTPFPLTKSPQYYTTKWLHNIKAISKSQPRI